MAKNDAPGWGDRPRLTARQKHWLDLLSNVEPGLKLGQLSTRLGEPYATVQRWAAFFGYPIHDGRSDRAARVEWSGVDWRQSNVEIARQLGISRERVRQVRREVGVAPGQSAAQKFEQFVLSHREQMEGLTVAQAVRASGVSLCYEVARDVLRASGVGPFRRQQKELKMDWRLPNRDLAAIYGMGVQQVANLRFRMNAGPAKWDVRGGRILSDPDYLAAHEAERRRNKGEPKRPRKAASSSAGREATDGRARSTKSRRSTPGLLNGSRTAGAANRFRSNGR